MQSLCSLANFDTRISCLYVSTSEALMTYLATGYRNRERYGYAASIGNLAWALTKGASDQEGAFDWGQVTGDT